MSILIDETTRVVVQGITGHEGTFHTNKILEYGTKVVAGVTPGKGGQVHLKIPVFNTVIEAVYEEGAIIAEGKGSAREKIRVLEEADVLVAKSPADIGPKVK
ncbi:MAG: hypothetical protein IBX60_05405 [Candidatus Aminicenantes bacterium]|nr:hypothetical protein [Candidatus Aminicenantes bacterium]